MIRIILLTIAVVALSSCAALLPRAPVAPAPAPVEASAVGGDPFTHVEIEGAARTAYKEIGIIEKMDAAGCDIRRFETMTSTRKSTISVDCK